MINISKKTITVSIILLFIMVGIHPAFAVDTRQSMVNKASEEDCGCNEVDNRQLVVLENQLDRLEVYSKLLLALSKHHPELTDTSIELSNKMSMLKGLFEELVTSLTFDDRLLCQILDIIYYETARLSEYYLDLGWEYRYYTIISFFFAGIGASLWFFSGFILLELVYYQVDCPHPTYF
jgi:hypothetical protein